MAPVLHHCAGGTYLNFRLRARAVVTVSARHGHTGRAFAAPDSVRLAAAAHPTPPGPGGALECSETHDPAGPPAAMPRPTVRQARLTRRRVADDSLDSVTDATPKPSSAQARRGLTPPDSRRRPGWQPAPGSLERPGLLGRKTRAQQSASRAPVGVTVGIGHGKSSATRSVGPVDCSLPGPGQEPASQCRVVPRRQQSQ